MITASNCPDCGFIITDSRCCKRKITEKQIDTWLIYADYPEGKTDKDMSRATLTKLHDLQRQNAEMLSEPSFAKWVFKCEELREENSFLKKRYDENKEIVESAKKLLLEAGIK